MRELRLPILVAIGGGGMLVLAMLFVPVSPPVADAAFPSPEPEAPRPIVEELPVVAPERELESVEHTSEETPRRPAAERKVEYDPRPVLLLFQRELGLTAEQYRLFRAALLERSRAVAEIQAGLDLETTFNTDEFAARINELKALTYEKMGRNLDALQHRRFLQLIAEGRLGDAIVFELPQGIDIRD